MTANRLILLACSIFWLSACSANRDGLRAPSLMSFEQCEKSDICSISGAMELTNDGHAYIGKVVMSDGRCVNVSVPLEAYRDYESGREKFQNQVSLRGRVFPYAYGDGFTETLINGRKVGYGKCGNFYVFVK